MKKLVLVISLALAWGAHSVAADTQSAAPTQQIAVDVNVLAVLIDIYSGSVEAVVPFVPNLAAKVDVGYSPNIFWVSNVNFLQLNVQGRYYLGPLLPKGLPDFVYGNALRGLFVGAGVGFYSVGYTSGTGSDKWEGSYFAPDFLVEVGDKYFFDSHFYAEGFTGFDITFPGSWTWKYNGSTVSSYPGYSNSYGVGGFRLGVNLGYAF